MPVVKPSIKEFAKRYRKNCVKTIRKDIKKGWATKAQISKEVAHFKRVHKQILGLKSVKR